MNTARGGLLAACLLGMLAWVLAVAFPAGGAVESEWVPGQSDQVRQAVALRDYQLAQSAPERTPPAAVGDPCLREWFLLLCEDGETATRLRVEAVFQERDWNTALEVARWESAHTFSPTIRNDLPCARKAGRKGYATGLFQHCDLFWPGREVKVRAWAERALSVSLPERLDILDGWHSVLAAGWLVYDTPGGWLHFHSCASSAKWWRENRGVGGGGWVPC